ncbi:MAG: hypothetical protein ACRC6X_03495 [Culicoidibacterales bacterium]
MKKRDLQRVDYPLEYLSFKFEDWSLHPLFLATNKNNWTKYLTNFASFISVDVLICESKEEMIRLIVWDSYLSWKSITPENVQAVDVKHRQEFPHQYTRFAQIYATDKHPLNLVSKLYKNEETIEAYQVNLNQQVLKITINLNKSGLTEQLLEKELKIFNTLCAHQNFISRDIYQNKFSPTEFELYYYLEVEEKEYNECSLFISRMLEAEDALQIDAKTEFNFLIRESIFYNDK